MVKSKALLDLPIMTEEEYSQKVEAYVDFFSNPDTFIPSDRIESVYLYVLKNSQYRNSRWAISAPELLEAWRNISSSEFSRLEALRCPRCEWRKENNSESIGPCPTHDTEKYVEWRQNKFTVSK